MEAAKRPCNNTKDEDHISKLPDFLIHHILTFVNIKHAVQTCMLSKRWRNIWTSLPFLTFDRSVLSEGGYQRFLDFVEYVLSFRDNRCFDIRRFHLLGRRGKHDCNFIKCLHRWIIVVARSNVEDIYVQFNGHNYNDEFRVPDCVFTCKSLTNLELDLSTSYKIILPNSISLPRLKYLRLGNTRLKHDELTKLCSSCPVLEHLDLSGVRSTKPLNITISSVTLRHLVISGISTTAPINITISSVTLKNFELHIDKSIRNTLRLYAPNLVYLFLSNLDYMLLEDVSSLFKADVGVQVKPRKLLNVEFPSVNAAEDTLESLKALHNVKELTLSFQPLKHVGRVEELLQTEPFHFSNLQRLELKKMSLSTESVHVIASLLKISPVLESLVVQLCQDVENSDESESDEASDFGSESEEEMELALHSDETTLDLEGKFTSTMKQLKFVEISGLEGSDSELKFIEILLKNAMVLQKLVLKKDPTGSSIEDITKFCEEVDKFPVSCLSLKTYFFFFNLMK